MSTTLKTLIGMLAAGLALAMVTLTAMAGTAEAQTTYGPSTAEQNTNQDTNGHTGAAAAAATTDRSSSSEPAVGHRVVGPGETLWSIAQERLGPNATPDRVADEVGRIYGTNRDRIGDDPNLVVAGQELSLPPAATDGPKTTGEAATPDGTAPARLDLTAAEPAEAETVVLPELPEGAKLVASSVKEPAAGADQNTRARRTTGYAVLLVTFAVAILGTWRLRAAERR